VSNTSATSLDPLPDKQLRHQSLSLDWSRADSHDDVLVLWQGLGELHTAPKTVRRLESGDDTLELGDHSEGSETLLVVGNDVLCPTGVLQVTVLGTDRVVVESWA
jgi:hypothetical protein